MTFTNQSGRMTSNNAINSIATLSEPHAALFKVPYGKR